MEQAVSEGKLRSIGLSNYYTAEDFDWLVNATTITPALLQNETHSHYFEIFNFELTDTEMQQIAAMDQNRRHSSY